jgi:hypothetical protein
MPERRGAITRLAAMPATRSATPRRALPLALAAGLILAAGCGSGDDEGTIPTDGEQALLDRLAAVEAALADGDCDLAASEADAFHDQANLLPKLEDQEVKTAIQEAGARLEELVATDCMAGTSGLDGQQDSDAAQAPPEEEVAPPAEEQQPVEEDEGDEGGDEGGEEGEEGGDEGGDTPEPPPGQDGEPPGQTGDGDGGTGTGGVGTDKARDRRGAD